MEAWNVSRKRCCDFFAGSVNRQRRYAWAFYTWWSHAEEFQNQRLLERMVCTLKTHKRGPLRAIGWKLGVQQQYNLCRQFSTKTDVACGQRGGAGGGGWSSRGRRKRLQITCTCFLRLCHRGRKPAWMHTQGQMKEMEKSSDVVSVLRL